MIVSECNVMQLLVYQNVAKPHSCLWNPSQVLQPLMYHLQSGNSRNVSTGCGL